MKSDLTVLLGGARSGKSAQAVKMAKQAGRPVTFVATGEARDEEMAERIRRHRRDRPVDWRTIEAPLELCRAIEDVSSGELLVIDDLTLWVANLIEKGTLESDVIMRNDEAIAAVATHTGGTIVVSNEVGMGIVPMHELSRTYRDLLGSVNSRWVAASSRAFLMVAGSAVRLDPPDARAGPSGDG